MTNKQSKMRTELTHKKLWLPLVILFAGIIITGCSSTTISEKRIKQPFETQPTEKTETQQIEEITEEIVEKEKNFIDFDIEIQGRNIEINGKTDVLDSSILSISINRLVEYNEMEGQRVVSLDNGEVKVINGQFTYSAYLTDRDWYEKELQENKNFGFSFKKIYENCYALITSENIQVEKDFKLLVEEGLFEKEYILSCSPYLKVDERCKLSKETPLMPELEPVDPLAALQKMKSIPA